eukprot:UN26560
MNITEWSFKELDEQGYVWDHWENLSLTYDITSPLNIVLRSEYMDYYNSLFRWLFLLKKSYHNLLKYKVRLKITNTEASKRTNQINSHMGRFPSNDLYTYQFTLSYTRKCN